MLCRNPGIGLASDISAVAWDSLGGARRGYQWGVEVNSGDRPYEPNWKVAPAFAQTAPRCRARCRRSKLPCRAPAMRGKPVCRLHGGKGGAPKGERNGAYRTGRYTGDARVESQATRALRRELRPLIDAGE